MPEIPEVRHAEPSALDLGESEAGIDVVGSQSKRGPPVDAAVAALLRVRGAPGCLCRPPLHLPYWTLRSRSDIARQTSLDERSGLDH